MRIMRTAAIFVGVSIATLLAGCWGGPVNVSIGGSVSGLAGGTNVGLTNNGTDPITVSSNGGFTFDQQITSGNGYDVEVSSQPVGETCTVTSGSGTVGGQGNNITNVSVSCLENISSNNEVFGNVSGLASGTSLTLLDNGGNPLSITANGAFVFSSGLATGAAYDVTVQTNPTGQTCTVTNGTGIMPSSGSITNVVVTCS